MLLWGPADDDGEWRAAGRARFESAYSPEDTIYEQLIHDSSTREVVLDPDRLSPDTRRQSAPGSGPIGPGR